MPERQSTICPLDLSKDVANSLFVHEIQASTWTEAYASLGARNKHVVWAELSTTLAGDYSQRLAIARKARSRTEALATSEIGLRCMLQAYLQYLDAWAGEDGADLAGYVDTFYPDQALDRRDLAFLLQHDNSGCATLEYRCADQSVALAHTEEDEKLRTSVPQLVRMRVGRSELVFFDYGYLLPGATFGWHLTEQRLLIQTVNMLHVQAMTERAGVLANTAAWMAMQADSIDAAEMMLRSLDGVVDGYIINQIVTRAGDTTVAARSMVVAHNVVYATDLAEKHGANLTQVNAIPDELLEQYPDLATCEFVGTPEEYNSEKRAWERRRARLRRMMYRTPERRLELLNVLDTFARFCAFRVGGKKALSRSDQVASFLALIRPGGEAAIVVAPGRATRDSVRRSTGHWRQTVGHE